MSQQVATIASIEELERQLLNAQLSADRKALDRLLSDGYVGINPDGSRVDKAAEIEALVTSGFTSGEMQKLNVRMQDTTAVAVGEISLVKGDVAQKYSFMDVFVGDRLIACAAFLA